MAQIISMADSESPELFSSVDEMRQAWSLRVKKWRANDWKVIENDHDQDRYTILDPTGQFIGEYCLEE